MNGPAYTGDLRTHIDCRGGGRTLVATLVAPGGRAQALVPDLYERVFTGMSVLAFELRGFELLDDG